ncbi:MAG TPA: hypothetical protein VFS97_11935 [Nitrososphaeraceae archaeon]|nr:hypothetical protein [Nitrososphaeraceae archaeon]
MPMSSSCPSNNSALPRRLEPVHTEPVSLDLLAIHLRRLALFTWMRVPVPPGTISKSSSGQVSLVTSQPSNSCVYKTSIYCSLQQKVLRLSIAYYAPKESISCDKISITVVRPVSYALTNLISLE